MKIIRDCVNIKQFVKTEAYALQRAADRDNFYRAAVKGRGKENGYSGNHKK